MKKMMKIAIVAFVMLVSSTGVALADGPGGPGSGPGGTGTPTGAPPIGGGAPIDGGLSILLALGAFYSAKTVYGKFKKD